MLHLTPVEVATRCRHLPGLVFFDTALDCASSDAISLIAAKPTSLLTGQTEEDWTALRDAVAARQFSQAASVHKIPCGFAAGWIDYNGTFCFGFYDKLLAYCHGSNAWFSVGGAQDEWAGLLSVECGFGVSPANHHGFTRTMQHEEFLGMVTHAKNYIAAGDIYQVNLSHRFTERWRDEDDPFAFYQDLRRASPSPYAAFLSLNGRSILSSSPELFLNISGRRISTKPIKGTRPRHADPIADAASAGELITSPKEIAELIMITDLERNDLGQVCEFGTVTVTELLKLERFEQVFHLVSTVEGCLRPEVDPVSTLHACFPGGSITGAPKKRAMEIIAELESVPRGLYTGSIGYFGFNGESQFNIAIRTVVIENGTAHFHVGAGIVADSEPTQEWQETLDKASGILLSAT